MDNNNTNASLLGFLQKKSLFSNSPSARSKNRSRSGSRDGRQFGRSNVYQLDDRSEAPSDRSGNLRYQPNEDNLRYDNFQPRSPQYGQMNSTFKPQEQQRRLDNFAGENRMYQPNQSLSDVRGDPRHYQSTPGNDFRPYQPPSPISELKNNHYSD